MAGKSCSLEARATRHILLRGVHPSQDMLTTTTTMTAVEMLSSACRGVRNIMMSSIGQNHTKQPHHRQQHLLLILEEVLRLVSDDDNEQEEEEDNKKRERKEKAGAQRT